MENAAPILRTPANDAAPALRLLLCLTDPEVVHELGRREEGPSREAYAKQALRIGVLAFRQANGALDATLTAHTSETKAALARLLGGYLDPASGSLPKRLEKLERVMRNRIAAAPGRPASLLLPLAQRAAKTDPLTNSSHVAFRT